MIGEPDSRNWSIWWEFGQFWGRKNRVQVVHKWRLTRFSLMSMMCVMDSHHKWGPCPLPLCVFALHRYWQQRTSPSSAELLFLISFLSILSSIHLSLLLHSSKGLSNGRLFRRYRRKYRRYLQYYPASPLCPALSPVTCGNDWLIAWRRTKKTNQTYFLSPSSIPFIPTKDLRRLLLPAACRLQKNTWPFFTN